MQPPDNEEIQYVCLHLDYCIYTVIYIRFLSVVCMKTFHITLIGNISSDTESHHGMLKFYFTAAQNIIINILVRHMIGKKTFLELCCWFNVLSMNRSNAIKSQNIYICNIFFVTIITNNSWRTWNSCKVYKMWKKYCMRINSMIL